MPDKKLGIELIGKDRLSPALRKIGGAFSQLGSKVANTFGRLRAFGTGLQRGLVNVIKDLPGMITKLAIPLAALGIGIQQAFRAAIENSGQLKREWGRLEAAGKKIFGVIGDLLAPAVSLLADQFDKLAKKAVTSGGQITNVFETKIGQLAEKALRWGVNVSTQFATGIVKGASAALVAAMNFIGGILSGWLQGHSPPKIAKDIGKWGAQAFTEWLRGFGNAEWDVLNGLQGPLQSSLQMLADMGKMAASAVGPAFVKLSREIAGALAEFQKSGKMPADLFSKLAKAGGQFGQDLAELARRQFAVAGATKAVEDAERRLAASRKGEDDARDKIIALRDEYKALLKSGADPRLIRAKQAEIKAAQGSLRAAKLGTVQAEKDVETAREKEDALQKQLYLQQQVVQQLLEMARAGLKIKLPTLGGIGGGAIELPALPTEQFAGLKSSLADAFKDIFKPFVDAYDKDMKPAIDGVIAKWAEFKETLLDFWNSEPVQKIRDWLADLFPEGTLETLGEWTGALLEAAIAVGILALAVALLTSPILLLGLGIAILAGLWAKHGDEIKLRAKQLAAIVLWEIMRMQKFWDDGVEGWKGTFANLKVIIDEIKEWISAKWNEGIEAWKGIFENAKKTLKEIWEQIVETIKGVFALDWGEVGRGIINGIKEGIKNAASNLARAAADAAKAALDAAKRLLGIGSPSKRAAKEIGAPLMAGIAEGIRKSKLPQLSLNDAMGSLMRGTSLTPAMAGVGVGGQTINLTINLTGGASKNDALMIAEAIDRKLRLKGVRRTVA